MTVFSKKNETFLLFAFLLVALIHGLYMFGSYLIYYQTGDCLCLKNLAPRDLIYNYLVMLLAMFYVLSLGFRLRASFDFPLFFFYGGYLLLFPYALVKAKGWLKGMLLIILWIVAFNLPSWGGYAAWHLTYWDYEFVDE